MSSEDCSGGSKWASNEAATQRVAQLLEESGALLEIHVSRLCQQFSDENTKKRGTRVNSESVTYGKETDEGPLRQIDQCVCLYKEFSIDETTGVQLIVHIPIEAKYRRDIQIFGVEFPPDSYRPRFPLVGFVRGSRLADNLTSVIPFLKIPLLQPVFIEIQGGATPQKVFGENLVHNVAAALYDFIRFDLHVDAKKEGMPEDEAIIHDMHLVDRFDRYLKEKHYIWWPVINSWIAENLTEPLVDEFNRRYSHGKVYHSIHAHIPVFCANGALWKYALPNFDSSKAMLTRVRVPGWPGSLRIDLVRYTVEAALVITNLDGLRYVLDASLEWFFSLERALRDADPKLISRWPIEAAFFRAAIRNALSKYPEGEVRSDLDVFNWV